MTPVACPRCGFQPWPAPVVAASPSESGLDVERLAEALAFAHPGPRPWPGKLTSAEFARALAAEYVRLAPLDTTARAIIEATVGLTASPEPALAASPSESGLDEKPPVKWASIRQDATERGLFSVVSEALLGKFSAERRKLLVGNIVIAVARWRETFRDCGCWKTADAYALCPWHERLFRPQREEAERLAAVLAASPSESGLDVERLARALRFGTRGTRVHVGIDEARALAPDIAVAYAAEKETP